MIAHQASYDAPRLTTTEELFRQLKANIISLSLIPGSKISEVEVAKAYEVSRQPVREAFMRLGELNLLEIRPQRATRVRKISHQDLRNTRFVRAAIEVEVVRVACRVANQESLGAIHENLEKQELAVKAGDSDALHRLDYQFHNLISIAADCLPAFKIIAENKAHTDRVCMLELADAKGMREVLEGHTDIFDAIRTRDEDLAAAKTRSHLNHLDATVASACESYPDYFED